MPLSDEIYQSFQISNADTARRLLEAHTGLDLVRGSKYVSWGGDWQWRGETLEGELVQIIFARKKIAHILVT